MSTEQPAPLRPRETDPAWRSYAEAREQFRWQVPPRFNMAWAACGRHAANPALADKPALHAVHYSGWQRSFTFRQMQEGTTRLAAALRARGIRAGDRVAVLMPQRPETVLAHLACYHLGAIAVPLTTLFRHDALHYRLADSGARAIVLGVDSLPLLDSVLAELPELQVLLVAREEGTAGEPPPSLHGRQPEDFWTALESAPDSLEQVLSGADDPALLIYTSGTTGNPKGALHAQRVLLGHLPGFELSHDFCPQPGDCFYSPAEWAWIGGLLDVLLPALYHGLPVVAWQGKGAFDPEHCFMMMAHHGVRNAFIPPTALRMMAQVPKVRERYELNLRSMMSGGEALGEATLAWAQETLGVRINEIYGQTEVNYVVGNCQPLWPVRPGSMGLPYPGHTVAVVDDAGQPLPAGSLGEVAVQRGEDPVFFMEYWGNHSATEEKYAGDWALTGDLAVCDEEGYLWFKGRKDDVIISAGHRIGPTEIEGVLNRHPAVALSAVIGVPDELRGQIVKAFIKLAPGHAPSDPLKHEIQDFVKDTLARHEYPRSIEFREEFPLTPTGKIRRLDLRLLEEARRSGEEPTAPDAAQEPQP